MNTAVYLQHQTNPNKFVDGVNYVEYRLPLSGGAYGYPQNHGRFRDQPSLRHGDFDNGMVLTSDGPYTNKPDDGNVSFAKDPNPGGP